MPAHRARDRITGRRSPALLPAVLFSIAAHAAAGTLLVESWRQVTVEPPRPLDVTLVAAPPPEVIEVPPPPAYQPPKPIASNRMPPPPRVLEYTIANPVAAERVETTAPVVAPVVEATPVPVIVAKVPTTVGVPQAPAAVEPPHFNVAYLNNPRPAYPPIARKLGLEGLVVLRVQVSAQGLPEQVAVAQTSGAQVLDEAALNAVRGWTFVPARKGDVAIAHAVDVPVRFQLKN